MKEPSKCLHMAGLISPETVARMAEAERINRYMATDDFSDEEVARVDDLALTTRMSLIEAYYRVRAERHMTPVQIQVFDELSRKTGLRLEDFLEATGGKL